MKNTYFYVNINHSLKTNNTNHNCNLCIQFHMYDFILWLLFYLQFPLDSKSTFLIQIFQIVNYCFWLMI